MAESANFPLAYQDGQWVPYERLAIHPESLAMRYALSAFEGVRGYLQADGQRVRFFALEEHLDRLRATLDQVQLPAPPVQELVGVAERLLQENRVREDCYLRIAANATSLGTIHTPASASYFVTLTRMARKPWLQEGKALSVALSSRCKPGDHIFPQRAKVISNYAGPRLAQLEAKRAGHDDVILRTQEGLLSEAPTANLFLVKDGVFRTPRLEHCILPGITRRHVLELCRQMGLKAEECALTPEDAHAADEAFLCGTGLELAPIRAFDGRALGSSRAHFTRLVSAYFELVRNLPPAPPAPKGDPT
jgi:branched-chain amino acid aminotransferase